jgi:hypothetical protein
LKEGGKVEYGSSSHFGPTVIISIDIYIYLNSECRYGSLFIYFEEKA